jgi:hypothetical protein
MQNKVPYKEKEPKTGFPTRRRSAKQGSLLGGGAQNRVPY